MNEFPDKLFLILTNGGGVLGIFVIVLLNTKGVRKTRANTFLSILLAALTFSILHIRYAGEVIQHYSVKVYSIGDPTFLLIAPLLWFYTIELTGGRVRLNFRNVLHFMPFLVVITFSVSMGSFLHDSGLSQFFRTHHRLPYTIFWMLLIVQFSSYQYLIHRKWREHQQVLTQEVSNTEDVNISWIRFFLIVFLIVNISFLFSLFAVIHLDIMPWIWKLIGVMLSLSIFALGYKGILQKEIFDPAYSNASTTITPPGKTEVADPLLLEKLLRYMTNERPYLDPDLSLSSLSQKMGMNRNQLSALINDGTGDNFYDFINKYRVEEVKRLMVDPTKQNYNLLGLALDAGFKSKSTFNLIFKRFTGLTPTEYRKNIT